MNIPDNAQEWAKAQSLPSPEYERAIERLQKSGVIIHSPEKWVPRDPTPEMMTAAAAALTEQRGDQAGLTVGSYRAIFQAMYDAANVPHEPIAAAPKGAA